MSEVKLNLVDADTILCGTIHGSVADSAVAALSAEPETITELEAALARYIKPDETGQFARFRSRPDIDPEPYDAGLVVIDLGARVVASESTYSQPGPEGHVYYHDGTQRTEIPISYHLPDDWRFVNSVESYLWSAERRRSERQANPPFDARAVLYGLPLIEFVFYSATGLREKSHAFPQEGEEAHEAMEREIMQVHASWLTIPRKDLRGHSPRDVMLEKQNLIELDMESRCMQWSIQGEGPPCLPPDSFAYRYSGFGIHEWVVYYDLVRFLLWTAFQRSEVNDQKSETRRQKSGVGGQKSEVIDQRAVDLAFAGSIGDSESLLFVAELEQAETAKGFGGARSVPSAIADGSPFTIVWLDQIKTNWLEQPSRDYDGRVPAIIIDNERRRLPITMTAEQIMIDEDCECCRMMAMEAEMGLGPTFWHLDGCNMEEEFAFSTCLTKDEWEAEMREREEFHRKFERDMEERRERIARGEIIEDEPCVTDMPF